MQRAALLALLPWAAAVAPAATSRHLDAKAPAEGAQVDEAHYRELPAASTKAFLGKAVDSTIEEVPGNVTPAAASSHPSVRTPPQPTGPAPPPGDAVGDAHTPPAEGTGVATYFKDLLNSTVEEVRSAGRKLWKWGTQPKQEGEAAPASEGRLDEVKEAAPTAPAVASTPLEASPAPVANPGNATLNSKTPVASEEVKEEAMSPQPKTESTAATAASAPLEASPAPLANSEKPALSSKPVVAPEEKVKAAAKPPQPKEGAAAPAANTPLEAIPLPQAGSEVPAASAEEMKEVAKLRARLTEVSKGLEAMVAPTGPLSHMEEASKLSALAAELNRALQETATVDDTSSAVDVNYALRVLKAGMDDMQTAKLALSHRMRELKTEEDVEFDAARLKKGLGQVEENSKVDPTAPAVASTPSEVSPALFANAERPALKSKPAHASEAELKEVAELRAALAKVSKGLAALVAPTSPISHMEEASKLSRLTEELDRVVQETATIDDASSAADVKLAVKRLKTGMENVQSAKQALSHRMKEIKTESDAEEKAVREPAKEDSEAVSTAMVASSTPREASPALAANPERMAPSSAEAAAASEGLREVAELRVRLAKVSKGLGALVAPGGPLSQTEQASKISGLTKELDRALQETAAIDRTSSAADVKVAVKHLKASVEDMQSINQGLSRRMEEIKTEESESSQALRASSEKTSVSAADASSEGAVQEAAPTAPAVTSSTPAEAKEVATPLQPKKESEADSPAALAASEETAQSGTPAAAPEEAVMQVAELRAKMTHMSKNLAALRGPTSPLSQTASNLLNGISETLHEALEDTADVDGHSSAADVQLAIGRLKSGMEDVQSLNQALSTRMEQLKTEQDVAEASRAVSDRMEQFRTALSGKPAAPTEDEAKLPQPQKEAEAASPAPAAASEETVQSGTPAVASKEAVMQVANLRAKMAKVSRGLAALVAGPLAKTELAKTFSGITEAINRALQETGAIDGNSSAANVQQAMKVLEAGMKDVQKAKAAITERRSQLTKEAQVQDSSLLMGVLMDHRDDPWSRQVEVLLDPAFSSLPAVQKVLAAQDKSTPLYKQVAAALDSSSKEADTASAEGNLTANAPAKTAAASPQAREGDLETLVAFTQLVHQTANSDCPYCLAQCLEKCHVQEKKDYSVCIVDCDGKQA